MTTTVKVSVDGRYKTKVKVTFATGYIEEVVIEGNYEGSPNPFNEHSFIFSLTPVIFEVSEGEAI